MHYLSSGRSQNTSFTPISPVRHLAALILPRNAFEICPCLSSHRDLHSKVTPHWEPHAASKRSPLLSLAILASPPSKDQNYSFQSQIRSSRSPAPRAFTASVAVRRRLGAAGWPPGRGWSAACRLGRLVSSRVQVPARVKLLRALKFLAHGGTDPSLAASEGSHPADTSLGDFQPPDLREGDCVLSPPGCGALSWGPQDMNPPRSAIM